MLRIILALFLALTSGTAAHAADSADVKKLVSLISKEPGPSGPGRFVNPRHSAHAHFAVDGTEYTIEYRDADKMRLPDKVEMPHRQPVLVIVVDRKPAGSTDFDYYLDRGGDGSVDLAFRGTQSSAGKQERTDMYITAVGGCLEMERNICGPVGKHNGSLQQQRYETALREATLELTRRKRE